MTVETLVPLTARPRGHPVASEPRVARALAEELSRRIRGEVRFGDGDRALYATDASNYRQLPIGVVIPHDVDDMVEAVAVARERDAPLLVRGGGTSLAGQCCNEAVVIDASKYVNRVLEIDAANRRARVEPGTVLDDLRKAAAPHGLTFGPDPATHDHNTLGGMIGNDSCGVHSVKWGRTADNVERLTARASQMVRDTYASLSPWQKVQLSRPHGVFAESDSLYVADSESHRILLLTP